MTNNSGRLYTAFMAVAIVAAIITAGCGGGGGGAGEAATASGTVRDDGTLQPIAGVEVSSAAASTTSAADGSFSLNTRSGTRTIVFAAADYTRRELSRTISAGANDLGTIYLGPAPLAGKGAVSGTVYQAGTPLANARIQSSGAEAIAKSDGTFTIYNLSSGQQALSAVSPDAQNSGYAVVEVPAAGTVTGVIIDVSLSPPTPPIF